jgi:hypothetical protein
MASDEKYVKALQGGIERRNAVLREILAVLEAGGDFQLGPKGKHRDLIQRIKKLLPDVLADDELDDV